MPGRLVNSSHNGTTPEHQFSPAQEHPIPAVRKTIRGLSAFQNGRSVNGGSTDGRDDDVHGRQLQQTHVTSDTRTTSYRQEHRQTGLATSSPVRSYQLPGQPQTTSAATLRPQSAMAFSSSSYNQTKTTYPTRPPSSLGVSWGPYPVVSGLSDLGPIRTPTSQNYNPRQQTWVSNKMPGTSGSPLTSHDSDSRTARYHGQDNLAYVADNQPRLLGDTSARPASTSLNMRSAWQRLYGNTIDPSPDPAVYGQGPSAFDDASVDRTRTFPDSLRAQGSSQQHGHLTSPQLTHSHRQHPYPHNPHSVQPNSKESAQTSAAAVTASGGTPSLSVRTNSQFPVGKMSSSSKFPVGNTSSSTQRTTIRESPTGQSSSNLDATSGSNNSSQLSTLSMTSKTFNSLIPEKKKSGSDSHPAIGPSSKYPDVQTGLQTSAQTSRQIGSHTRIEEKRPDSRLSLSSAKQKSPTRFNSATNDSVCFSNKEHFTQAPSRSTSAFLSSDDSFDDENSLKPHDSMFDYHEGVSEDECATPRTSSQVITHSPLQPSRSANSTPIGASPRSPHRSSPGAPLPGFVAKTPDLLRKSSQGWTNVQTANKQPGHLAAEQTERRHINGAFRDNRTSRDRVSSNKVRSRSLDDLRESENDSLLSFDIENTILTVEPSDQSDRGTVQSHKGSNSVRAQLTRLEGMYSSVMKTLEDTRHGTRTRRRWSIGSSDTSSFRHHTHQGRHSRTSGHKPGSRDVRAIGKRFQRLESHVITLARSVAHLSSELRAQNSLSREIENVKREMQELKSQSSTLPVQPGNLVRSNRLLSDFEKCQGWVPSLTNPRRVNKLTKFFGQEPPLLEIFLKQLGYEKFLKNFETEHVGMIELPYMTEEKLQSLGIPMGPRLRILQEAQVYFQQTDQDVYFV